MRRLSSEERLEYASVALAMAATMALTLTIRLRGMGFAWDHAVMAFGTVLGPLALAIFYRTKRPDPLVAKLSLALALQIWTAYAVGGIGLAALGWQAPLADNFLAAADRALGFDSVAWTATVASMPLLATICGLAYVVSVGAVFCATILLTFLKRPGRVTELSFLFAATMLMFAMIGMVFPAYGPFTYLKIKASIIHALPPGAGTYYVPAMQLYRSGAATVIDLTRLVGVITFPSFHTCMALMVTYAFRGMPRYFWPVAMFNLLVGLSIVPIGGHYVIDILGGGAVFAVAVIAASALRNPSPAAMESTARALAHGQSPPSLNAADA